MRRVAGPHRVVLTYGRFDLLGQQHIKLLRRLSEFGNELIVGCTTDDFALFSGLPCVQSFDVRRAVLAKCRFVSRVIVEETFEQKRTDIVNYNVSVFAMGTAWAGQFDDLRDITQVRYLSDHDAIDAFSDKRHSAFA